MECRTYVAYALVLCWIVLPSTLRGQDSITIQWCTLDDCPAAIQAILPIHLDGNFQDIMVKTIRDIHEESYLAASIDSVELGADTLSCHLYTGPSFAWSYLDLTQVPKSLSDAVRLSDRRGKAFSYQEVNDLFERILTKAENNGYPFASVRLDSVRIEANAVSAIVRANLNDRVTIDKIRLEGDLKISQEYLQYFLGIAPGDDFDRSKLQQIRSRLAERPFIKILSEPDVSFLGSSATINLSLDRKPANQFDILLGLLPSPIEGRRFQLTGNVNVTMENQFGAGERFHMNFESLRPQTQELELDFSYPFIFNLPFGSDFAFDLYRRDTTFLDVNYEIGIEYFMSAATRLKFYVTTSSSRLLSVDRQRIQTTKTLPEQLDLSRSTFGLGIINSSLDYRFNPRKGRYLEVRLGAGTKRIKRNETILNLTDPSEPEFDFSTLYDDLSLSSFQYDITTEASFYLPLFSQSALKVSNRSGIRGSGSPLFRNELFRIGGTKLLRGFNEEALFVNRYSVFSLEYRLLFTQNSNLFLFSDIGIIQSRLPSSTVNDTPVGIGTGINLETKVGIFGISYAIGRQRGVPFSFRDGRVHFGMVSLF
ncbi:MAG: BamA/TamA family outer membrane protein [Saprospiraceae bacterium]|nr:BamA/TamA family outer membrane protein [Saprospiraceae bacterium]